MGIRVNVRVPVGLASTALPIISNVSVFDGFNIPFLA